MRRIALPLALAGLASHPALAQPSPASNGEQAIAELRTTARALLERADAIERALRPAAPADPAAVHPEQAGAPPPADENVSVAAARLRRAGAERQALQAGIAQGVANGPNDRLLRSGLSPEIQLTATSKDKIATLAWTIDVSGAPRPGTLAATQFTMTASTSLDSQGEAQIVGLRGFPGGTEIKLNLIHYFTNFRPAASERPQVSQARENCRRVKREEGVAEADLAAQCDPYGRNLGRFVLDYNPDQYRQMLDDALPGAIWFFGGDVTANQTDFNYLDQPSFTMQKVSRFGYGGTLFGGGIFRHGLTSLTGSFTYGRRYRARDSITLCQAINAVPQTQCITAPGGPPTRRNQAILALELRHSFGAPVGEFASMAIAPEFSIDLNNDSYSLDVPLYLIGDGQGRLRGGVRLGYVNSPQDGGGRDDDFSLGLFVGVPFSVFR